MKRTGVYPPLGLTVLSDFLHQHAPDVVVEILDGTILGLEEICARIDGDLVGVSPTIVSYECALKIAETSKAKGAVVVFGGQHSAAIHKSILENRSFVDYVITGDGEEALLGLVNGTRISDVSNLFSRQHGYNAVSEFDLSKQPPPGFFGVALEDYYSNFVTQYGHWGFKRALPMYSHRGCPWQAATGGCIFCRNQAISVRVKSPAQFWREINWLQANHDADLIWDVSDTITMDLQWLSHIVSTKPKDCTVRFLVYSRCADITPHSVELLAKMGCHEVMIGVESGDPGVLRTSRKGGSVRAGLNAAKLLSESGILVFPAFILGLPGESDRSIATTYELVKTMIRDYSISQIACTPLIPIPGSRAMQMLQGKLGVECEFDSSDSIDIRSIVSAWLEEFTLIDLDSMIGWLKSILSLHEISSSFGKDILP